MDFNRLITTLGRMFSRRLATWGIRKGAGMAAGKGKPAAQMTREERQLARKGREAAKLARKAARVTRRLR